MIAKAKWLDLESTDLKLKLVDSPSYAHFIVILKWAIIPYIVIWIVMYVFQILALHSIVCIDANIYGTCHFAYVRECSFLLSKSMKTAVINPCVD